MHILPLLPQITEKRANFGSCISGPYYYKLRRTAQIIRKVHQILATSQQIRSDILSKQQQDWPQTK